MDTSFLSFFEENKEYLEAQYPGLKILRLSQEFEQCNHLTIKEFQRELLTGKPLEYISNVSHFYRESFFVDESVLIPRSETEILVENSVKFIKDHNCKSIFEVGLGSGCISLSIAMDIKDPLKIEGSDISSLAISIANKNKLRHKSLINQHEITFYEMDKITKECFYDFVVSNPPYIRKRQDASGVHEQTNKFEPELALYIEDEYFTSWFRDLFKKVSSSLRNKGAFYMEGHEDSLDELQKVALTYFNKVDIISDYTGRKRFLHCYKGFENG